MADEPDDWVKDHLADIRETGVRALCRGAAETGNPLLFFQALKGALADALERAILDAEASGTSGEEAVRVGFAADKTVRLPAELHRFLQGAMWRLCELEEGRDFRECPDGPAAYAPWGSPDHEAYRKEWRAYRDRDKHGGERLAPNAAAKMVPLALGITRPGFNAFTLSEKRDWAAIAAQEEADALRRGASKMQARYEAMERLGYTDERSFRRLKSRKPRGRGKPGG